MTSLNEPDSEKLRTVEMDAGLSPWSPRIPNPEEPAIFKERVTIMQAQLAELSAEDEEIDLVFMCFQGDITKPSEIAEFLEWEVSKVNNALKRIRRKLRSDPQPSSTMPRSSFPNEKKAFRRQR
jgi:DNA-directed RNA polymerase specialized sigma24 family protein